MECIKKINGLKIIPIRKENSNEERYDVTDADGRVDLCNVSLLEAVMYCQRTEKYIKAKSKVIPLSNINCSRLDNGKILVNYTTKDNRYFEMISEYPTFELARKDFKYKMEKII